MLFWISGDDTAMQVAQRATLSWIGIAEFHAEWSFGGHDDLDCV